MSNVNLLCTFQIQSLLKCLLIALVTRSWSLINDAWGGGKSSS